MHETNGCRIFLFTPVGCILTEPVSDMKNALITAYGGETVLKKKIGYP